jgi:glutamine amidotransferase
MQLLFKSSTEFGTTAGLDLIPGIVDRIPVADTTLRLPHIAWAPVQMHNRTDSRLFDGIDENLAGFYFVHSYAATNVPPKYVAATVSYGNLQLVAAVRRQNIWGTQFHPEKSGPQGLHLLKNFISIC